ncbi:MAG: penicillin-binding protein 2 [Gemmatimonadales bacterium]|nr:MAG: penicillin-binding protein 2 [Gemmatimonadales bacterium]
MPSGWPWPDSWSSSSWGDSGQSRAGAEPSPSNPLSPPAHQDIAGPNMKAAHPNQRRLRARGGIIVLVVLLGVLALAFFRAQVVRQSTWALQSDSNRLRVLQVPAPRGTIFDRYGRIIADNVPSYSVSLFPSAPDSVRAALDRLAPVLELDEDRKGRLMEAFLADRRQPLLVKGNLSGEELASVAEMRARVPGLFLETRPRRRYIHGESLGHVIGYVSEVSAAELESPRFSEYERGMIIGKDGLERQYEEALQGTTGVRYVEVDAVGRVVGSFEGHAAAPALPGEDLTLSLDLELQDFIHRNWPEGMRGAAVALDVEDGGVLALYSAPSFDPSHFVGGISSERWEELNRNDALLNRATNEWYPPASTWKLATAAIALEAGVLDPEENMPVPCTGAFRFQNRTARCHNPAGHGHQNLAQAVANSCNVYFYQVGIRVGLDRLLEEATALGFGEPCGIDLPSERSPRFPESRDWWQRTHNYRPFENEVMSLAIGQGPNDQTVLRMAQFYLGLARGGDAPPPTLRRPDPGEEIPPAWELDLDQHSADALLASLAEVTASGTAARSTLEHFDLIGKTGTAQHSVPGAPSHAWFAGMAGPFGERPEIVVVVLVEAGESGSGVAAPAAARAADFHLRARHGIPQDSLRTRRDWEEAGVPPTWYWERQAARASGATGPQED